MTVQFPEHAEVFPRCQYSGHVGVRTPVEAKERASLMSRSYLHMGACGYGAVHHREGSVVFIFEELRLSFTYEFWRVAAIIDNFCVAQ